MKLLKAAVIGSALTIGFAGQAFAADYTPPVQPEAAPTPEQYEQMGFYLRGDIGWSFLQWSENDNALAIGGGVGYQFNDYLRSDVRVDWSGNYEVGPDADLNMTTALGNLYVDIPTESIFTPYVGGGLGYGWANIENAEDKSGLTYSLMAGVSIDLSESVELDAGYRYREIVDEGRDPKDHSVLGGIRFKF
jgi:opacity protein-like surface antigen